MGDLGVGVYYYVCSFNPFLVPRGPRLDDNQIWLCLVSLSPQIATLSLGALLLPHVGGWSQLILKINPSIPFDKGNNF